MSGSIDDDLVALLRDMHDRAASVYPLPDGAVLNDINLLAAIGQIITLTGRTLAWHEKNSLEVTR